MASTVGQKRFLFTPTITSLPNSAGDMFGSESLPAREKYCSTLASCGRCEDSHLLEDDKVQREAEAEVPHHLRPRARRDECGQ